MADGTIRAVANPSIKSSNTPLRPAGIVNCGHCAPTIKEEGCSNAQNTPSLSTPTSGATINRKPSIDGGKP